MYADSHLHTSFSGDSETNPEDQIRTAISLGMQEITITDHYDLDFPSDELDFTFNLESYRNTLNLLKEKYSEKIQIHMGVELGLQPHLSSQIPELASGLPFEFIIGSTHVTRGIDPYYEDQFMEGLTEEEAYRTYFEEELENLRTFDCYDVAGHIDYIVRYGPNRNRYYSYAAYQDILDEILRTLIVKGKGLECNTAGYRAGLGYPHPMPDLLRRYRELGGEILTIGSDAHTPDRLGQYFEDAGSLLKSLGFRYYTVFRERRPNFLPL